MNNRLSSALFSAAAAFVLSNPAEAGFPVAAIETGKKTQDCAFAQVFAPGMPFQNSLGMRFVPVPGTDALFSIWDTRVQDYAAFAKATDRDWSKPAYRQTSTDPAVCVSLQDAHAFCEWLTHKELREGMIGPRDEYRIPTDAEWSLAVGLGVEEGKTPADKDRQVKNVYPWGEDWPPPKGAGNYADASLYKIQTVFGRIEGYDDGFPYTSPVGSFAPNRFGLYDMGGNVLQWCEDFYDKDSELRVKRGGFLYLALATDALSSARFQCRTDESGDNSGFRCVLVRVPEHDLLSRAHALAFAAVVAGIRKSPVNHLRFNRSFDAERQALETETGVHSRAEFLQMLRRLENGTYGHRGAYWAYLNQAGALRLEGSAALPITAWDFGRYISLCQSGYTAEFLTEAEAWDRILPVARLLQSTYNSWDEFSADYLRGLTFANPRNAAINADQLGDIMAELSEAPDGLWATIPWDQSLGKGLIAIDRLAETIRRKQSPSNPGPQSLPKTRTSTTF